MSKRVVEYFDYSTCSYLDGVLHSFDNNPAVEYKDGTKMWFYRGKRHKIDGPAVEYSDGTKYWFIYGNLVSEEEYNFYITKTI